jgi:hypothetical protein
LTRVWRMYPKIPHIMAVKGCGGLQKGEQERWAKRSKIKGISTYVLLLAISSKISADMRVVL